MKTLLFNIYFILLLPGLLLADNPGWKGRYTKEKKINKEYKVSADALLKINNSYGNLYVTSWNQNRVVIEVHIKTNGNNEEKVQRKLDEIDVEFTASPGTVSAITKFENNKWGWSWWKNDNVSMEINYTIKVPVGNSVDLNNDYGSINLDKINGKAHISCDYGRINLGELNADNNLLSFDYTSNSTIGFIKSGKISADYSGYEIEKAGNLEISADYTSSKIMDAENIHYSCDYGNISIENARNIEGNGDYLTTKFGVLHGNIRIRSDYGSIKIDELAADAGNVEIRSDYTGIKIGYNPNYHFNFSFNLEYAGLRGGEDFDFRIKRENNTDKYYEGHYGSEGKNSVNITADYGSVSFNRN
ncbi:hypothetical protein [Abyssalbus ytuae]|uniref:Adhesin domain-containing protein n=1 Tax=Abyssalbus ytuae TaxID=2926907 RepID=A0A9E6ZLY2_9FLAO|nr:hypothetical protein [Abyssalbus ytuae]UOB18242.1 hypothetical protein MQE35_02840 [Abyssalbus ytuae]